MTASQVEIKRRVGALTRRWPWLPLLLAGIYLVVLAADFKGLVQAIYLSADISSAPMIAELSDDAPPGSEVRLGYFPWYEAYWFETLTRWAPAHRQVWQLAPYLLSLAGIAFVAWSAGRAAGRWAGTMVAVALGCAGAGLLTYLFAWSIHAAVWFHAPLLGAFLVLCAARGGLVGPLPVHLPAAAALTLFTAVGVASDKLLLVAGVAPLAVAGFALAWLVEAPVGRRLALTAWGVAAGSLLLSLPIAAVARDAGVLAAELPITFATFDRLGPNVRILFESLAYLAGGDFGGQEPGAGAVLQLLCAAAVGLGAIWAFRCTRRFLSGASPDPVQAAHVVFWSSTAAIGALVFVLSSLPMDKFSSRYVIGVLYGIAALLPVAAVHSRALRAAVVAGVSAIALSGVVSLAEKDLQDNPARYPTGIVSGQLAELVREEGLHHGYAGYWDAAPLTWQTKGEARVYPVGACPGSARDEPEYCPVPFHRIDAWYVPTPGVRTFLVVDRTQPSVHAPDPGFGRAERVARIGQLEVHVYDYDIAARLGS